MRATAERGSLLMRGIFGAYGLLFVLSFSLFGKFMLAGIFGIEVGCLVLLFYGFKWAKWPYVALATLAFLCEVQSVWALFPRLLTMPDVYLEIYGLRWIALLCGRMVVSLLVDALSVALLLFSKSVNLFLDCQRARRTGKSDAEQDEFSDNEEN